MSYNKPAGNNYTSQYATSSNTGSAPVYKKPRRGVLESLKHIAFLALMIWAMPILSKIISRPWVIIVIVISVGAAWYLPKIIKHFKK